MCEPANVRASASPAPGFRGGTRGMPAWGWRGPPAPGRMTRRRRLGGQTRVPRVVVLVVVPELIEPVPPIELSPYPEPDPAPPFPARAPLSSRRQAQIASALSATTMVPQIGVYGRN